MSEQQLRKLSVAVGEKLKANGQWITCAESCTGGAIAKAITDIAGSSAYFDRGFVTYSNTAKHELLGVAEATLNAHGAVSEEVVREMAQGLCTRLGPTWRCRLAALPDRTVAAWKNRWVRSGLVLPNPQDACWRKRCNFPAIVMQCGFRRQFSRCKPPLTNFCEIRLDTV